MVENILRVHISNMSEQTVKQLFGETASKFHGFDANITGLADCTGMAVGV